MRLRAHWQERWNSRTGAGNLGQMLATWGKLQSCRGDELWRVRLSHLLKSRDLEKT